MADEKKKPSLGEASAFPKLKAEPKPADDDDGYSAAVDELAEVLGVPDDKVGEFVAAFKAACMACK